MPTPIKTLLKIATIALLLNGCATHYGARPPLSKLTQGMSQFEILAIMGSPEETSNSGDREALMYSWDDPMDGGIGASEEYYVLLSDGKLAQYGILTKGSATTFGLMKAVEQSTSKAFPDKGN